MGKSNEMVKHNLRSVNREIYVYLSEWDGNKIVNL